MTKLIHLMKSMHELKSAKAEDIQLNFNALSRMFLQREFHFESMILEYDLINPRERSFDPMRILEEKSFEGFFN